MAVLTARHNSYDSMMMTQDQQHVESTYYIVTIENKINFLPLYINSVR